jgi:hypothetical protein
MQPPQQSLKGAANTLACGTTLTPGAMSYDIQGPSLVNHHNQRNTLLFNLAHAKGRPRGIRRSKRRAEDQEIRGRSQRFFRDASKRGREGMKEARRFTRGRDRTATCGGRTTKVLAASEGGVALVISEEVAGAAREYVQCFGVRLGL